MTAAPAAPATELPPPPPPAADERRGPVAFVSRHRVWFAGATALLIAIAIAVWAGSGDQRFGDPLDPQNPDPDGAQALARVLEDQGVDVTVARSAADLADADAGADTTVVVTGTGQLAPSTIQRLRRDARGADVVLVEPPSYVLDEIEHDVAETTAGDEPSGDCSDERFDDLTITVDSATGYETDRGCFPSGDGFVLGEGRWATYLGAGQALSNDQVLRGDNAAVALRLLGQHERLVWYVPSYADAADDEAVSIWAFAPDWLVPSLWLVGLAVVVLVWWRARRLGRLAVEPLPVVVRAVETTRSRGRLYRRADDRGYAAHALRAAAQRRLADHLRLGRGASEADVIGAVARHLGRPEGAVAAVLARTAPVPASDHDLVWLAQELTQLDREVRRA